MRAATSPSPARPRGRPRSFDEDRVLGAVLDTFWTKGYAATSLDDLAAAGGVKRPSLYAAFGGKEEMYLRALALFETGLAAELKHCLDPSLPLAEGLRALYRDGIETYLAGPAGPRGCLAVCTATAAAVEEPAIRAALRRVLARVDQALTVRLETALEKGEIPKGAQPRALAGIAAASLHSIAVRARAGTPKAELIALADAAVGLVASGSPKKGGRASTRRSAAGV